MDQHIYDLRQRFREALDDDLNVAGALAALFEFVRRLNPLLDKKVLSRDNLNQVEEVLGQLNQVLNVMAFEEAALDEESSRLLSERDQARQARNWAEADRLREELQARGIKVIDTSSGTRWQRI